MAKGNKNSTVAISHIPHILFLVAQIYCGIFVILLIGPPLYVFFDSYKDTYQFNIHDFKKPKTLADKLMEESDSLSQCLQEQFPGKTKKLREKNDGINVPKEDFDEALVSYLNKLISDDYLYEQCFTTFLTDTFSEETQELMNGSHDKEITHLNRMLLVESYPNEIVKACKNKNTIINFDDLFSSFPNWWRKLRKLKTGEMALLIFLSFPLGFIFAEMFYRISTLEIPPGGKRNNDVTKELEDLGDNNLIKLLEKKKVIKEWPLLTKKIKKWLDKEKVMKNWPKLKEIMKELIEKMAKAKNDYVYHFDVNIKGKDQLEKRLKQISIKRGTRERILDIFDKLPSRIPILNSSWQYMHDINLELSEKEYFKTRCYIQRDMSLQRAWDWENFQSSFCLYTEAVLIVFDFLFLLLMIYIFYLSNLSIGIFIDFPNLFCSENFCMLNCVFILLSSVFLTLLAVRARVSKFKTFEKAHIAIKDIIDKEQNNG